MMIFQHWVASAKTRQREAFELGTDHTGERLVVWGFKGRLRQIKNSRVPSVELGMPGSTITLDRPCVLPSAGRTA